MLKHIEALRKKPKAVRNSYAFGAALSITLAIALVWLVSLPSRIDVQSSVVSDNADNAPRLSDDLSGLKNLLSDGIEDIQNQAKLIETAAEQLTVTTTATSTEPPQINDELQAEASTTADAI